MGFVVILFKRKLQFLQHSQVLILICSIVQMTKFCKCARYTGDIICNTDAININNNNSISLR
jgi:hypothetical protein